MMLKMVKQSSKSTEHGENMHKSLKWFLGVFFVVVFIITSVLCCFAF